MECIGVMGIPICIRGLTAIVGCIWDNDGPVVFVAVGGGGRKLNGGMEGVIGGRP